MPMPAAGQKRFDPDAILAVLLQWLQTPRGAAACDAATGFVPVCDAVSMCADLRELTCGGLAPVAEAVRASGPLGPIVCDEEGRAVRLRSLLERVAAAAEGHVLSLKVSSIGLHDLLRAPPVRALLCDVPETVEQVQTLHDAIGQSEFLEVQGSSVVLRQMWPAVGPDWWTVPDGWALPHDAASELCPESWPAIGQDFSAAGWWPKVRSRKGRARRGGFRREHFCHRREWICAMIARELENPLPQVLAVMGVDGSVAISDLFNACPRLSETLFGNKDTTMRSVLMSLRGRVTGDGATQTVRLKTLHEQLCDACEEYLTVKLQDEPTPLGELLCYPPVQGAFARAAGSSSDDASVMVATLVQALGDSEFLEITEQSAGLHMVSLRPRGQIVRRVVEEMLDTEPKARAILAREGEVPVSWVVEHPDVARCLVRAGVRSGQACLDAVRDGVDALERYELDSRRMSACPASAQEAKRAPSARVWSPELAREGAVNWRRRVLPSDRDARKLRDLLAFYFDLFNLQHNHVLMALIEAERRKPAEHRQPTGNAGGHAGYLRSRGQRPVFRLEDLFVLPRIAKLFEAYEPDAAPMLLAAAMQADEWLPVRVRAAPHEPGAARGAWAAASPRLELTYVPNLRFVEVMHPCPEVRPLLEPGVDATEPVQPLPQHAFLVLSYSVSSDLSHSKSPKAKTVFDQISSGNIDPWFITWDCRQQRIKRQLLLYNPDIICIQGLQSIGFAERCSEFESDWFCLEDEPVANHLVHLYRQVSKANYGVAFAPTMKLPGSHVLCFGNAIFWKRSRWQVERRWNAQNTAVGAQLASRCTGLRLAVCSSKPAAVYVKDWGDNETQVSDEELAETLQEAQKSLVQAIGASGARPLWCGDFGIELRPLLPALRAQVLPGMEPPAWRSACTSLLGEDPWTSVSRRTEHCAVDLILHDGGLQVLGVLGGLQSQVSLTDVLKSGFPSDHLMQIAVFTESQHAANVATGGSPLPAAEPAEPQAAVGKPGGTAPAAVAVPHIHGADFQ